MWTSMNAARKATIATHMPLAQIRRDLSSVLAILGSRVLEYSVKISTNATREQQIVMHVNSAPTQSALIHVHVKQYLKETKRPENVTISTNVKGEPITATKPTPIAKTLLDHTPAYVRPASNRGATIVEISTNVAEILTNVLHTPHAQTLGVHTPARVGLALKEMVEFAMILTNAQMRQITAQNLDFLEFVPTLLALFGVLVTKATNTKTTNA